MKGSRWILVKNRIELTAVEEQKLTNVLEGSPELRELYLLKEEFRSICEKIANRSQAVGSWKRGYARQSMRTTST